MGHLSPVQLMQAGLVVMQSPLMRCVKTVNASPRFSVGYLMSGVVKPSNGVAPSYLIRWHRLGLVRSPHVMTRKHHPLKGRNRPYLSLHVAQVRVSKSRRHHLFAMRRWPPVVIGMLCQSRRGVPVRRQPRQESVQSVRNA